MEASVKGGGFAGERLTGGKSPVVGDAIGFTGSEIVSTLAKLPEREWPLDREVAVPERRSPGVDGSSGGGGETGTRVGRAAAAAALATTA